MPNVLKLTRHEQRLPRLRRRTYEEADGRNQMPHADKTAKKQRGKPFAPGQSGNPLGRPHGARNRATLAAEVLLDGEAGELTRKAIELGKSGNLAALRLCLDRVLPPRKDRPLAFDLPLLEKAEDAPKAMGAIAAAIASGALTISEAAEVSKIVEIFIRTLEATDLERRLRAVEEQRK
jgi:hypothetical protein